jgi:amidase
VPITRRDLFATAALSGGAAALPSIAAAQQPAARQPTAQQPSDFELDELTVVDLQRHMRSGRYSARSLTEKYLARIAEIDRQGPALHSVIETNPDAVAIARALDEERRATGPRGPMHGIPVLIKDNIETADRMMTTAGSLALEGSVAMQDSFVAQRLRAAGAVILGKTNLSEWANYRSTHSSSGWSGRGGQVRNPYILDRNPCGSSSGSGSAGSANLAAVTIGTETDGSIVCPSALCGLVGIKPTVGLISRSGIVPISASQDTAGPMCRTVADAAALLSVLTGVDPRDSATSASAGKSAADYTQFLDPNGLRGARIGVARKFFGYSRDVDALMESCIAEMKRLGAVIVDPADLPDSDVGHFESIVLSYEFKDGLNKYLAGTRPSVAVRSLADAIAFNEKNSTREMPYFGQEIFLQSLSRGPLTDKAYTDALEKCRTLSREQGIDAVLRKNNLQALVAPAGGPAWLIDLITGDHDTGGSSSPAAVAGYPNIAVPAGFARGLPVGISFFGAAWSEPVLIKLAYAFEQATKVRRKPSFLPTARL